MINNFFVILLKWFISFTWFPPKNDYFISLWFSQMIHLFPHLISSHDSLIFTRCFSHLFYLWSSHTIHTVLFFTWWIFTWFFSHDSFIYFTVIVFKRDPPPHTHTKWFICFDLWFFSHDLWDFLTRISLFLRRNIFTFSRSVINLWGKIKHALEQHRSISPRV